MAGFMDRWRNSAANRKRDPYGGFGGPAPQGVSAAEWDADSGFNIGRLRGAMGQVLRGNTGEADEAAAMGAFSGFDPRAAFKEYSAGSLAETRSALSEELEKLAGSASGMGRLQTGFYDEDVGDVARKIYGDHDARVSGAALQTAGMRLNQLGTGANMAFDKRNRWLGLLGDSYNRLFAERERERESGGGGLLGGLGGILGGVAGAALGPIGSSIGNSIGKRLRF